MQIGSEEAYNSRFRERAIVFIRNAYRVERFRRFMGWVWLFLWTVIFIDFAHAFYLTTRYHNDFRKYPDDNILPVPLWAITPFLLYCIYKRIRRLWTINRLAHPNPEKENAGAAHLGSSHPVHGINRRSDEASWRDFGDMSN